MVWEIRTNLIFYVRFIWVCAPSLTRLFWAAVSQGRLRTCQLLSVTGEWPKSITPIGCYVNIQWARDDESAQTCTNLDNNMNKIQMCSYGAKQEVDLNLRNRSFGLVTSAIIEFSLSDYGPLLCQIEVLSSQAVHHSLWWRTLPRNFTNWNRFKSDLFGYLVHRGWNVPWRPWFPL